MSTQGQHLFNLLPALYRLKDAGLNFLSPADAAELQSLLAATAPLTPAQQLRLTQLSRGPLQSLLMLIEEQFTILAEDLNQSYDDHFIETCAPWVIPYIGDLVGYQLVNGIAPAVASPRAEVANTIALRRRKGTVLVLEQLARDVTGWGAHAVESFKLLSATQYMKHIRPGANYTPDLHNSQIAATTNTAFDTSAHTVDVRQIARQRGRYNIQNVGIFLWSLNAYSVTRSPLTPLSGSQQFFRLSSLGIDIPLFVNPASQGSEITTAATPANVPAPLTRRLLCADLQSGVGAMYYGEGRSLALYLNNTLLNPYQIQVCDLAGKDGSWANTPTAAAHNPYTVCFDPDSGRLTLVNPPTGTTIPTLEATYYYGFNADMGGGEYAQSDSTAVTPTLFNTASQPATTLQDALNTAVASIGEEGEATLQITDSGTYTLTNSPALTINVPAGATLTLEAAPGCRPTLILDGAIQVTGAALSTFNLNGLVLALTPPSAAVKVPAALLHVPTGDQNQLSSLAIADCTLVPGSSLATNGQPQSAYAAVPALLAELSGLAITVQNSITGSLHITPEANITITNTLVDACHPTAVAYSSTDGTSGGGSLTLESCTVIGKLHATLFSLISNSILWSSLASKDTWTAPVLADRKQQGCVRFSYLPAGAVIPRQFKCVQQATGSPQPLFYSLRYGAPGYGKLWPATDPCIRQGAEDAGEMGAFHFVLAPLRENDLRVRLQEYLPVGLQFGIFYQN